MNPPVAARASKSSHPLAARPPEGFFAAGEQCYIDGAWTGKASSRDQSGQRRRACRKYRS